MFRGARTFVATTIEAIKTELNRFAGDVHEGFRSVDQDIGSAQTDIGVLQTDVAALQALTPNAGTQANGTAIVGATPHTFDTTAITPTGSGIFLVIASISTDMVGFSVSLRVDGANVASLTTAPSASGGSATVARVVVLDPAVTHTFGVQASGSGGATTQIGAAQVTWVEL